MTAQQYRAALDRLGLTQAEAAEVLGKCVRTSNGYANGKPIPKTVARLLERLSFPEATMLLSENY